MKSWIVLSPLAAVVMVTASSAAHAQASCEATNDNGDARCSVTCQVGQSAECANGTGSSAPSCECRGDPAERLFRTPRTRAKPSSVSQTDVLSSINRRLATLKDYELGQSCTQEKVGRECYHDCAPTRVQSKGRKPLFEELRHCHISCWDVIETVCRPVYGKLTAREPFAIEKDPTVTIKEPNWSSIPGEILGYRETYTNCTSAQQSITFKHLENVRVGSRVTKTSSLQTSEKIEAKLEFKFENLFGGGTSIGFSRQVTVTSVDEENHEESRTLDFTVPLIVPAMTRVVLDHAWIRRVVPVQYSGTVQLDAAVNSNRAGISRISQVITVPADRTFAFSGTITNTLLVEGETSTVGTDLTKPQCDKRPGFERTPEPYTATVR